MYADQLNMFTFFTFTDLQNGGTHLSNGKAGGGREIVLGSGMHVNFNSGVLQITPNPLCIADQYAWDMVPGRGEFQHSPGSQVVTTAQHHGNSASMESVSHTTSGGEETTTSSGGASTASPGAHSNGGLLSTFHPLLPVSPHNTSSQPLLGDDPQWRSSPQGEHNYPYQHTRHSSASSGGHRRPLSFNQPQHTPYTQVPMEEQNATLTHSQSGSGDDPHKHANNSDAAVPHNGSLRQSQSEHSYHPPHQNSGGDASAPPRPPRHKPAAMQHSQSYHPASSSPDNYATFPRPHQQPHVHKVSSCSQIQSQGAYIVFNSYHINTFER